MSDLLAPSMRLYDDRGRRLYLSPVERRRFIRVAKTRPIEVHALCHCLAYTGCRISEALLLRPFDLQADEGLLTIHSLKKRRPGHIREIPIPDELTSLLTRMARDDHRFWPIGRTTAWRQVKLVMHYAGIFGPQATAKGLRHAFAVNALLNSVPPMILQKWMGHADLNTTAIYTQVCGAEERAIAAKMWV